MTTYNTVATVTAAGDLNGKSKAEAAEATRVKLLDELAAWETLGYERTSNVTLAYKPNAVGMRWVASVKMSKEG